MADGFDVSFFTCKTDATPGQRRLSWPELSALLTRHERREGKDGRLWSPTRYPAGVGRGKSNVEAVSCLVLDFDNGMAPGPLRKTWAGYSYALHSTHSNEPDHPRWRVAFPLTAPVLAAEWPALYARAVAALAPGQTDPSCKDCSRIYYLPACRQIAVPFVAVQEGELLNPGTLPEITSAPAAGNGKSASRAIAGRGEYSTLDVVGWFRAHSAYGRALGGGKHAVLCPWESSHTDQNRDAAEDTDTAVWEASGNIWPQFHCLHGHCAGRSIADVIERWGDADRFCSSEFSTGWSAGTALERAVSASQVVDETQARRPNFVTIQPLTLKGNDPPSAIATVNGQRLELRNIELIEWRRFKSACINRLHFVPTLPPLRGQSGSLPPQIVYEQLVLAPALEHAVIEETVPDAGLSGVIWEAVRTYLLTNKIGGDYEAAIKGRYASEIESRFIFRGEKLRVWLGKERPQLGASPDGLWDVVRSHGGQEIRPRVEGKQVRFWSLASEAVREEGCDAA